MVRRLEQEDPVEGWQAAVRACLRRAHETSLRPELRLEISFGFALFAFCVGAARGAASAAGIFVVATSVLLTHELARAAWARWLGHSSRISLSITGAQSEISRPELQGGLAFGLAVVGSIVNLVLALGALLAVQHVAAARSNSLLHQLFAAHAVWALAQLLPFLPFRMGLALARRLPSRHRRWHAIASAFFAMNFAVWVFELSRAPTCLVVLGCAAFAALKAAREAFAEIRDQRSGAEAMAAEARALLRIGNSRRAAVAARSALGLAQSGSLVRELWATLAWAGIAEQNPFLAHTALLNLPGDALDVYLLASYLNCCNRIDEALDLLQDARRFGQRSAETSKLLIELLFARGDQAEARAIAQSDTAMLTLEDRQAVETALT